MNNEAIWKKQQELAALIAEENERRGWKPISAHEPTLDKIIEASAKGELELTPDMRKVIAEYELRKKAAAKAEGDPND
ncbi:hypothetical protein [Streptomyces gobiensis]|uniref:hypothetical protein n=1 Tax=Streptomyces gobiensis TaxID=2875706 RepID=UPI001E3F95E6|nr:hypothetical protein [Streptomyces gobiensis]UGY94051.1 hypothetical protein test1122_21595 [Streptomyces gobiensis]